MSTGQSTEHLTISYEELVSRLRAWAETQDRPWRAAFNLLAAQGHWLRNGEFRRLCVNDDDGTLWIDWWEVEEHLSAESAFLTASSGERAVLRFAVQVARDSLGLSSLDKTNRNLVVDSLADALGVI